MTTILLDTTDKAEIEKAKAIALENGWLLQEKRKSLPILPPHKEGNELGDYIRNYISKGGVTSFPNDVSAWQRKTRKDKLYLGVTHDNR